MIENTINSGLFVYSIWLALTAFIVKRWLMAQIIKKVILHGQVTDEDDEDGK